MYMKFLILFFALVLIPISAQAHTGLLSSTPIEGENFKTLNNVELVFDTNIQEGSTMSIEGENDSFEFESLVIQENRLVGTFNETLPSGSYQILWNIIGEDEHPIEGEIPIGISVETAEQENEANNATLSRSSEKTPDKSKAATSEAEKTQVENGSNLSVLIILVVAAILAIYGVYRLLLKK